MMAWLRKVKTWFVGLSKKVNLSELARQRKALSPRDLCEHKFATKQVWTRIATRKFELQNKLTCKTCSYTVIAAIN